MLESNNKYQVYFDDHCGVCQIGAKLSKSKLNVHEEDVKKLSDAPKAKEQYNCLIDPQKACDELAVVDKHSQEVTYGWPGIQLLLKEHRPHWNWPHWKMMQGIYMFFYGLIASNRRIIAPIKVDGSVCQPTYKPSKRILLSIICAVIGWTLIPQIWYTGPTLNFIIVIFLWILLELIKSLLFFKTKDHRSHYFASSLFTLMLFQSVYVLIHWSTFFLLFYIIGLLLISFLSVLWISERLFFKKRSWIYGLLWALTHIVFQLYLLDQSFMSSY